LFAFSFCLFFSNGLPTRAFLFCVYTTPPMANQPNTDIVNYTDISSRLHPSEVMNLLHRLYTAFDEVTLRHNLFKVETIGDSYMVSISIHQIHL
jgi:hypothetical protein